MTAPRPVMALPIGEIAEGEHIGLIDEGALACLTARLAIEGQCIPALVRRNGNRAAHPWTLVAGRHRYRAAMALGWATLDAVQCADERDGADVLKRIQVAENLDRRVLRPIERALHIMHRWGEIAATMPVSATVADTQQRAAIRARWSVSATVADTSAVDAKVAETCGCSVRTVQSYRAIHAALVVALPDLFASLNAHPLGESLSAMDRLAKLNPTARRQAAETMLARSDWPSLDAVMVAAELSDSKGNRPPADNHEAHILGRWDRMPLRAKRGVGIEIATIAPPTVAAAMIEAFQKRGLLP